MTRRYIIRALVWIILAGLLTVITFLNYRLFITNSVEKDLEVEQTYAVQVKQKLSSIRRKINDYNKKTIEDNRFVYFIPDFYDEGRVILDNVERVLLTIDGKLVSSLDITDALPKNIDFPGGKNSIHGKRVSVIIEVSPNKLDDLFVELQNNVRLSIFGDFRYNVPSDPTAKIRVSLSYYIFYLHETA